MFGLHQHEHEEVSVEGCEVVQHHIHVHAGNCPVGGRLEVPFVTPQGRRIVKFDRWAKIVSSLDEETTVAVEWCKEEGTQTYAVDLVGSLGNASGSVEAYVNIYLAMLEKSLRPDAASYPQAVQDSKHVGEQVLEPQPILSPLPAAKLRVSPLAVGTLPLDSLGPAFPLLQEDKTPSRVETRKDPSMDQARTWYQEGRDRLKAGDVSGALALFSRSAEAGYSRAQGQLGVHYLKTNKACAIAWFEKAATGNHAPSQINLGLIYARGDGVPKDIKRGLNYFKAAMTQKEDLDAQQKAATHYAKYVARCQPAGNPNPLQNL